MFYLLSFQSIRILSIFCHFLVTTVLLWTREDSIVVSLNAHYQPKEYNTQRDRYLSIIGFALIGLLWKAVCFSLTYHTISLLSAINIFLDVIGTFFVIWIFLDGLEWVNYIYIFVFCMQVYVSFFSIFPLQFVLIFTVMWNNRWLPVICDILNGLAYYQKDMWGSRRELTGLTGRISNFVMYCLSRIVDFFRRCFSS